MTAKRWIISSPDEAKAAALSKELKVKALYGQLLVSRGIGTFEEARAFFRPSLSDLHDPFRMKDMEKAVRRIDAAVRNGEKILIYGDYDVDGTTAVAVVLSFLREHHSRIDFYIPERYREGYGISSAGIRYANENGFSLIIALDCGIKAMKQIEDAGSLGMDVIVCDHHLPDKDLPAAWAVLNPKQSDCSYPYKELCGCGIGFKLITALAQYWHLPDEDVFAYLDLVAAGIAADIVPITGENRVLAFYGLKKLNSNPLPGLKALLQLGCGNQKSDRQLTVEDLVFIIAPRVNAAGRMDVADKAVRMFIEKDFDQAMLYAEMLHKDNTDRKDLDKSITEEVLSIIEQEELHSRHTTVLYRSHWHKGVVGIVASRVMETYYRPTIILAQSQDKVSGSARSVKNFNIYDALHQCHDLLENYGGHFYAAGMTLKTENVQAFAEKFEAVVSSTIDPELLTPEIKIDATINLSRITASLYQTLRQFEPFGPGNLRPIFMASGVQDTGYSKILKNEHIHFEIRQGNSEIFPGIGFKMAGKFDLVSSGKPFDICFGLDENEWNGKRFIQLKVIDVRAGNRTTPFRN
jgi:single-stranded-DNA-specific exonuclease